ncbi:MAG: FAD-dependent oxidoreductase, partial [Deltaproteobacteria bacterium]|nr:FAD-dependent oxidoreductase [Deltaproteobacteria bacterium]
MRLSKELLPQPDHDRERAPSGRRAAVVGGGIAGVAAAAVLAERGVDVVLVERESFLGGRAGAWTDELKDGQSFEMERGFHAFFRQYYNLRSLLRRVDPELSVLKQTDDYPILGPGGLEETFTDLPNRPPLNVIALTRRTPHLGWRDLMKVNAKAALAMLAFDPEHTYARFDDRSAKSYLDSLRFPPKARAMLFNVFAHSFFNPEDDYSAAELLMMFHFYFMGNPEGLIFDVANRPFSTAIWKPFEDYLRALGVEIRLGEAATSIRKNGSGWRLETSEVH